MIPILDLKRQYKNIKSELNNAMLDVLASGNYVMGENVRYFEKEFAQYIGVKNAISVGNGTDALIIALRALDIKAGDEIMTTPFTFFATAEAISFVGAIPVFVDIEIDSYNIDTTKIEEKITNKTKAIIAVHIFGLCADMDIINKIAKKYNLYVIEDACQAAGAVYKSKKAGALGDVACFSFFPTKNLGCAGDGGMITTNDDHIALLCKALRVHGSGKAGEDAYNYIHNKHIAQADDASYNPKYLNYMIGQNSRLDELQAALLRIKLKKLDEFIFLRRENASFYNQQLKEAENYNTPIEKNGSIHAYHLYVLQSTNRQEVIHLLNNKGISTGIYYPIPLHLQICYKNLGYKKGDLPNAEYVSERTYAIPNFPELTKQELQYIVNVLRKVI
jgi:dTDP-4-amino-4,6-dideoxygalactose transaminase